MSLLSHYIRDIQYPILFSNTYVYHIECSRVCGTLPLINRGEHKTFHDIIRQAQLFYDRGNIISCNLITEFRAFYATRTNFNYDDVHLSTGDLFPGSFWNSYWEYLERYSEARRTLDELRATEDPLLHFLSLRQAAARHSPSSLLLLSVSY